MAVQNMQYIEAYECILPTLVEAATSLGSRYTGSQVSLVHSLQFSEPTVIAQKAS